VALLLVSLPFAALLVACTARRAVFLVASLLPPRRPAGEGTPSVVLLLAAVDEEDGIGRALDSLARLDYPAPLLRVVLVDDGSTDRTPELFRAWAAARPLATVVELPYRVGKFAALTEALARTPASDVIAICDADMSLRPDWLRRLVEPFADPCVGAAAAYISPANAAAGPVARYAAVESWVHQLVTSAAKDRLRLDPPTLGACAYRRIAFEEIGGFGDAASGGDVLTSAALVRAGWRTRFVRAAVAENLVAHSVRGYWHQHIRWARNLGGVARTRPRRAAAGPRPGPARRLEAWLSASGYADRLAFVVVAAAALAGILPWWLPIAYVAVTGLEVVVGAARGGAGAALPLFLLAATGVFVLDVVATGAALAAQAARRPRTWRRSARAAET